MHTNLLPEPIRAKDLEIDELRKLINVLSWSRFEAACYLTGKALLSLEEFKIFSPSDEELNGLLENDSSDSGSHQVFQKYKTKYPDVEEVYTALGRLSKGRMKNVKVDDKTNVIESAEPMIWIKLAIENDLYVAPGIEEAWIIFLHRPKKRYFPPKANSQLSKEGKSQKANPRKRRSINTRPLHESADINNIQELGRTLFRENLEWGKQEIAKEICTRYPRATCYNQLTLVKWLNWANIARRIKGGHKNLPNVI